MKKNRWGIPVVVLSVTLVAPFVSGCIGGVCGVESAQELEPGSEASADEAPGHEHDDPCSEATGDENSAMEHPRYCQCPNCINTETTN